MNASTARTTAHRTAHPTGRRRQAVLGWGAVALLTLSACGGAGGGGAESPSPEAGQGTTTAASPDAAGSPSSESSPSEESVPEIDEIWGEVASNLEDAESLTIESDTESRGVSRVLDISGFIDDSYYEGVLSEGEVSMEFKGNAEVEYIKPNEAFLKERAGAAAEDMAGKWLTGMSEEDIVSMTFFHQTLVDILPPASQFDSGFSGEAAELDGRQVYHYSGTPEGLPAPVNLYITPEKQLVKLEIPAQNLPSSSASPSASASSDGTDVPYDVWTLSDWNAVEKGEMPAQDEVMEIPTP